MKYTAEEVRAIAKRLHDDITVADGDALMASDMLTAYAERIAADEPVAQGEPVAWPLRIGSSNIWSVCDTEALADFYGRQSGTKYEKRPLYTTPPAQPAERVVEGWKLGMAVLQSDLYRELSEEDRAICDALVASNPNIPATQRTNR